MATLETLADPTDFGNRPGDGPLRAGGQGAPSDPGERDLPSTMSPARKRQEKSLTLVRDLWEGLERLRDAGATYLPHSPAEDAHNYKSRLMRSVFFNAFRRTVEGLTGLVFRRDPVLGEDVPPQMQEHWENVDNAGTHGDVFSRDLLEDALAAGHVAILVDYPTVSEQEVSDGTQARREATGELRPYWVPIKKDDIISWWTTVEDGRTILAQIVIRERSVVRSGMFRQREQVRYRVLTRTRGADGGVVIGWRLLEVSKDEAVLQVGAGTYPTQDEIPVVEIAASGRRDLFDSDPPLRDLAYINVAHYQMWSDYMWSIHKTCVPFIFGAGIEEATDEQGNKIPLVVGGNAAVLMANPDAKMGYVAHSGESLDETKKALDDLKSDMGTLGLAMLAPQKRTAETAEAKRLDKATSDSALSVTARRLQDGLERALHFHARYMGLESGGSIEVNRDFEGLLMEAPVMQAFAQLVQAGFPPRPVLQALQAGGRIGPDEDLDALEMEWLAGAAAKEAARQAEREAMAEPDPLETAA